MREPSRMMPESLTLTLAHEQVQVVFRAATLTAGTGAHWLTYEVMLTPRWVDPLAADSTTPLHLAGTLWCTNSGMTRVADLAPQIAALRDFPTQELLSFPLTTEQVLALDAARLDGALQLDLKLSAALLGPRAGAHGQVHSEAPLRIEPEHWLQQLDGLGAELSLMLRVPAPLTDPGAVGPPPAGPTAPAAASCGQAVARLRQARQELRDGSYETSVRTSRLAMDSLDMLNPLPPAEPLHAKQSDQRDQAERWAVLRYALRNLVSGAAHDDGPTVTVWSKADAEAVLVATGSLFARMPSDLGKGDGARCARDPSIGNRHRGARAVRRLPSVQPSARRRTRPPPRLTAAGRQRRPTPAASLHSSRSGVSRLSVGCRDGSLVIVRRRD